MVIHKTYQSLLLLRRVAPLLAVWVFLACESSVYADETQLPNLFGFDAVRLSARQQEGSTVWKHWKQIEQAMDNDSLVHPFGQMPAPVKRQWQAVQAYYPKLSPLEQIRLISGFFNLWPSKTDMEIYGQEEYWATPQEFIAHFGGDCEDYVIVKYKALQLLGWATDHMWIVLLQENELKRGHAVLVVAIQGTYYVLDNLSTPRDLALDQAKYSGHYTPYYAFNGHGMWGFRHPLHSGDKSGKATTSSKLPKPNMPAQQHMEPSTESSRTSPAQAPKQ